MEINAAIRNQALQHECPWCHSEPQERCNVSRGVHAQRVHLVVGEPEKKRHGRKPAFLQQEYGQKIKHLPHLRHS